MAGSDQGQAGDAGRLAASLRVLYASALGIDVSEIRDEASFIALGGDSYKAIRLAQRCAESGIAAPLGALLGQSLQQVALAAAYYTTKDSDDACALQVPLAGGYLDGHGLSSEDLVERHAVFPLLPRDYDLSKVLAELRKFDSTLGLDDVEDIYPCSPMQEAMFMARQVGSPNLYQTKLLVQVGEHYGVETIRHAWEDIVRAHGSLRTIHVESAVPGSESLLVAVVLRDLAPRVHWQRIGSSNDWEDVRRLRVLGRQDAASGSRVLQREPNKGGAPQLVTIFTYEQEQEPEVDVRHPPQHNTLGSTSSSSGPPGPLVQFEIDHLNVDGASLVIILEQLARGLRGEQVPRQPPGYSRYIAYLQQQKAQGDAALGYWLEYLEDCDPCYFPRLTLDLLPGYYGHMQAASAHAHSRAQLEGSFETWELPLSSIGSLASGVLELVRAFCRRAGITIAHAFQAVWAVVLAMYTGHSDVCFGFLSSGRSPDLAGAAEIVGPLLNMLVCRATGLSPASTCPHAGTVLDLLVRMRNDSIDALEHQCFPLNKVQRILGTVEGRLFNTCMTCLYAPSSLLHEAHGALSFVASHNASDFDIVVKVSYTDTDIRASFAYSRAALTPSGAEMVAHTFTHVLERLATADSEGGLGNSLEATGIMSISTHDMDLINRWNQRTLEAGYPRRPAAAVLHSLFDQVASHLSQSPAVAAWDGALDYARLAELSTAVARQIHSHDDLEPKAAVPVLMEKSKWFTVAILGILKSGRAFVPISLSNPDARLRKMLSQLSISEGSGLVICSPTQQVRVSGWVKTTMVLDDTILSGNILSSPCSRPDVPSPSPSPPFSQLPSVHPHDPAYIIFTSGSTGAPKAVVVQHGAYAAAARLHRGPRGIRIDHTSRVLQFASYGFDTSIEDHLTTLLCGGCLCVPSEQDRVDITRLADFAGRTNVNWAHLTPSFADILTPDLFPTLKTMVLGGEPMTQKNIRAWGGQADEATCGACGTAAEDGVAATCLIQVYGPSECCVTSTIGNPATSPGDATDIGTAMPGCATWVVHPDQPNLLLPVGATGELLMEGPILAQGYLNDKALTDQAFVSGLSWGPDKRLYRTGDMVRYDERGHLHFMGRKHGSRIKRRGQMVELGEVERELAAVPQLGHAVALAPRDGPCSRSLVAIVTLEEDETQGRTTAAGAFDPAGRSKLEDGSCEATRSSWKPFLLRRPWAGHIQAMTDVLLDSLPSYMVPDIWLLAHELPRTSSAKIDRRCMQQYLEGLSPDEYRELVQMMQSGGDDPGSEGQQKFTAVERLLLGIWSRVLALPEGEIGLTDSFLYLGGDSITAITASSLARDRGLILSAGDILRLRTIGRCALAATWAAPVSRGPCSDGGSSSATLIARSPARASGQDGRDIETERTIPLSGEDLAEDGSLFPLSLTQQLHFLFHPWGDRYHQQTIIVCAKHSSFTQMSLLRSLHEVLRAHPMLRARFYPQGPGGWAQAVSPLVSPPLDPEDDTSTMFERIAAHVRVRFHAGKSHSYVLRCVSEANSLIDITHGPLMAVDIFQQLEPGRDSNDGASLLMSMSAHHLVVDTLSWGVILNDLNDLLLQSPDNNSSTAGERITETTSFQHWSAAQTMHVVGPALGRGESLLLPTTGTSAADVETTKSHLAHHWQSPTDMLEFWRLGDKKGLNTSRDSTLTSVELGAGETAALLASCRKLEVDVSDVICAAVVLSFEAIFARPPSPLCAEGHGREQLKSSPGLDVSRTVGWFTRFSYVHVPKYVPAQNAREPTRPLLWGLCVLLSASRNEDAGAGPIIARQLPPSRMTDEDPASQQVPFAEVMLNHMGSALGQLRRPGSVLELCDDGMLLDRIDRVRIAQRSDSRRFSLISLLSHVTNGRLVLRIEWNRHMIPPKGDVPSWIRKMQDVLEEASCSLADGEHGVTPTTSCLANAGPTPMVTIGISQARLEGIMTVVSQQTALSERQIEAVYPCSPIQDGLMLAQLNAYRTGKDHLAAYNQHFLFQLVPARQDGTDPVPVRIGPFQVLEAWKAVVRKHAILRTVFVEENSGDDAFVQVVIRPSNGLEPDAECVQLEDKAELQVHRVWARRLDQPAPAPLSGRMLHRMRIYYSQEDDAGHVFCLLSKNHLITDGMSTRLLTSELTSAIRLANTISTHELPGVFELQAAVPYSEYIKHVCSQDKDSLTSYWIKYLDGVTACRLPSPRHKPEHEKARTPTTQAPPDHSRFSRVTCTLDDSLVGKMKATCRRLDMTVPVIFQTAWAIVLKTYVSPRDHVLFGSMSLGRDIPGLPEAARIVGPMATMLPVRVDFFKDAMTILELCRLVRDGYIEHLRQGFVPSLPRIMNAHRQNGQGATVGQEELFNTMISIQRLATGHDRHRDISCNLLRAEDTTEFDVALSITEESEGRFDVSIECPSEFMSEAQTQRLLDVFTTAVGAVVTHPEGQVRDMTLITDRDKAAISKWNFLRENPPRLEDRRIDEMVHETTRRQPSLPAVCAWDGQLTYQELDRLAVGLAVRLHGAGARPGTVVALCFEKSKWAVASMLAVAKAGAAFVHLDPHGPQKLAGAVLDQARASIVLTSRQLRENVAGFSGTRMLLVGEDEACSPPSQDAQHYAGTLEPEAKPSDTLYIIFTSGTTGTPKGIITSHRAFCSSIASTIPQYGLGPGSRVLQFANYCFDASLEETLAVLAAGGCVCIPAGEDALNNVPGIVRQMGINWAGFTPSFMKTLDPAELVGAGLRFLTFFAEPMTQGLVQQWSAAGADICIKQTYGPSECSVTSTVGAPLTELTSAANIGWPSGCRAWIVDAQNHNILLPVGAVGELLIEGPIVGGGYLHDVEKTRHAFIPPPEWAADFAGYFDGVGYSTEVFYKTGDVVSYQEDGSLMFLGRKDSSQVKIRGQRVELDQTQHHLNDLPGLVKHGLAVVPNNGILQGRLVAVVSLVGLEYRAPPPPPPPRNQLLGSGHEHEHEDIVEIVDKSLLSVPSASRVNGMIEAVVAALEGHLPRYANPGTWLVVREIPMTASLKMDRGAVVRWLEGMSQQTLAVSLQLLEDDGHDTCRDPEVTLSETEHRIRNAWAEVLRTPAHRISPVNSHFFRLGGDSILAMRVAKLCRAAGVSLTTRDVLNKPTIRELAQAAESEKGRSLLPVPVLERPRLATRSQPVAPQARAGQPGATGTRFPCSPFQHHVYHVSRESHGAFYLYNVLSEVHGMTGTDPSSRILEAWKTTCAECDMLRTVFLHVPGPAPEPSDGGRGIMHIPVLQRIRDNTSDHGADAETQRCDSELEARQLAEAHLEQTRGRLFEDADGSPKPPHSLRVLSTRDGRIFAHLIMSHVLVDHVSLARILAGWRRRLLSSPGPTTYDNGPAGDRSPRSYLGYIDTIYATRSVVTSNAFWVRALRDLQPCLISSHATRPAVGLVVERVRFRVDLSPSNANVHGFCRSAGVTLANLLQFSWAALLRLCTGCGDVSFGCLVSDRDQDLLGTDANEARAPGDLANTDVVGPMLALVVSRANLGEASKHLLTALQEMQDLNIRALAHRTFDLDEVVRTLGCHDSGLFDTLFNFRRLHHLDHSSGRDTRLDTPGQSSQEPVRLGWKSVWKQDVYEQPLVIAFDEAGSGLDAELLYHRDRFSAGFVRQLPGIYLAILFGMVGGKYTRCSDLQTAAVGTEYSTMMTR